MLSISVWIYDMFLIDNGVSGLVKVPKQFIPSEAPVPRQCPQFFRARWSLRSSESKKRSCPVASAKLNNSCDYRVYGKYIYMCIYIPLSTVQFKGFWNSHHSKIIQLCWPRHGRVIESTRSGSDLVVKLVRIRTVLVRMCRLSIPLLIHYLPYLFFAGTKKK